MASHPISSPIKEQTAALRSPSKQSSRASSSPSKQQRSSPIKSPSKSGRLSRSFSRLSIAESSDIFESPSVLLQIDQAVIKAGFPGDAVPQVTYQMKGLWGEEDDDNENDNDNDSNDNDNENNNENSTSNVPPVRLRLGMILREILVQRLLVTPRHMTVFVLEGPTISSPIKQLIGQVLLLDLQVTSVTFQPATLCSVIGAGTVHGIVVDMSWDETVVTPVYDLRELTASSRFTNRGTKRLFNRYLEILPNTVIATSWHEFGHQKSLAEVPPEDVRRIAEETLARDEGIHSDDNEYSLARVINKVISSLDTDLRVCSENIMFVGGIESPEVDEVHKLIVNEVRDSWPKARQVHSIGSWSGASAYLFTVIAQHSQTH